MTTEKKTFSFLKGYSFEFECEGHHIESWFSAFSGLEKVFVDGLLVASQRNLNKSSENRFFVDDPSCSTSLDASNLLKGPFVCTLLRDGEPIKKQRLVFPVPKPSQNRFWYWLGFFVLLGVAFGAVQSHFSLPDSSFWVFLVIAAVVSIVASMGQRVDPYIEEEEYV